MLCCIICSYLTNLYLKEARIIHPKIKLLFLNSSLTSNEHLIWKFYENKIYLLYDLQKGTDAEQKSKNCKYRNKRDSEIRQNAKGKKYNLSTRNKIPQKLYQMWNEKIRNELKT